MMTGGFGQNIGKLFSELKLVANNLAFHLCSSQLMTTGAFSRNVGKLFSELKLVTDNLFFHNYEITNEHSYS